MKTYFRLLSFAKPYRQFIPEYILWAFFAVIFGVVNFTLLVPLLQVLFGNLPVEPAHDPGAFSFSISYFIDLFNYYFHRVIQQQGKMAALQYVCAVVLVSVLIANISRYMSQRVITRMRVKVVQVIREKMFQKFTVLPLSFFHSRKKGDLLSTISGDVVEIENSVVSSMQSVFRDPFMIIAYFITLFRFSVSLTFFTLFFFPVAGLIIVTISKRLKKNAHKGQQLLGSILSISEETISGNRIVKAFNAEKFVQKKFHDENNFFARLARNMINQRELASPLSEFLGVLTIVGVILYGGQMVLNGNLSAPGFIAYIAIFSQILTPAKSISTAVTNINKGLAAGERVLKIIDTENEIQDRSGAESIAEFKNKIEFKNVSFRYEESYVLKNINLQIEKGKIIALVGSSGSGKSTLTDLMPRFYDVVEGEVMIDGKNIMQLKMHDLRHLIGMVSQEPILFNDTVFNNISFGIENATEEEVVRAAKIAHAHDFIMKMENGYQTYIGDRGNKMSGGEKQRMTIARAVFKNPPIMILDEATSSLDTQSEKIVQEALNNLMKDRTTIVIAHRLSTIQHADEIVVMQKGEIVERGTHDSLVSLNGIYKALANMQAF